MAVYFPRELVVKILGYRKLSIDERRGLGITPGKIDVPPHVTAVLHTIPKRRYYPDENLTNVFLGQRGGQSYVYLMFVHSRFRGTQTNALIIKGHTGPYFEPAAVHDGDNKCCAPYPQTQ